MVAASSVTQGGQNSTGYVPGLRLSNKANVALRGLVEIFRASVGPSVAAFCLRSVLLQVALSLEVPPLNAGLL